MSIKLDKLGADRDRALRKRNEWDAKCFCHGLSHANCEHRGYRSLCASEPEGEHRFDQQRKKQSICILPVPTVPGNVLQYKEIFHFPR